VNWRLLVLPNFAMILIWALFVPRTFLPGVVAFWTLQALWTGFTVWRWCVVMKRAAIDADRKYDLVGKFRLAREYRNTESATAALNHKKKKNG
jgi:hypothetical protein